jgi:hypothetical protein
MKIEVKKYLASIGSKGGSSKSPAKKLAARLNAKLPRKRNPKSAPARQRKGK